MTAREVVHHIVDCELIEGLRLRRILAEEDPHPAPAGKDEHRHYVRTERAIETSMEVFGAVVLANAALAERLTDSQPAPTGTPSPVHPHIVEDWLRRRSRHAHEHVEQMLKACGRGLEG